MICSAKLQIMLQQDSAAYSTDRRWSCAKILLAIEMTVKHWPNEICGCLIYLFIFCH